MLVNNTHRNLRIRRGEDMVFINGDHGNDKYIEDHTGKGKPWSNVIIILYQIYRIKLHVHYLY